MPNQTEPTLSDRCDEAMARAICNLDGLGACLCMQPATGCCNDMRNPASAARLALLSELDAAGWQIVPKEATREMVTAAIDRPADPDAIMYGSIYRAMLAAAPKPFGGGE